MQIQKHRRSRRPSHLDPLVDTAYWHIHLRPASLGRNKARKLRRARREAIGVSMSTVPFKPKAYVKEGCPFSFKLLLFLAESAMIQQVQVIRCDPETPEFDAIKSRLQAGLHKPASFPTVEIEPDRYLSDSDALIEHFASKRKIDISKLPVLSFYKETLLPQLLRLHEEDRK
jgi:hypothetical protein